LGAVQHWESLGRGAALDLLPPQTAALSVGKDETLSLLLSGWAGILAQGLPAQVPVLVPQDDPAYEWRLMGLGAAAAVLASLLHAGMQHYQSRSLGADMVFLRGVESQVRALETEVKKYQDMRDQLQKKQEPSHARLTATPEVLAGLRRRFAVLLGELSAYDSEDLVIDEIRTLPGAVIVNGVSLSASASNALASAMELRLQDLGWRVDPPRKTALALAAGGGPWAFEIQLVDTGTAGFSALAAPVPMPRFGGGGRPW
jgi:hypothetical protein